MIYNVWNNLKWIFCTHKILYLDETLLNIRDNLLSILTPNNNRPEIFII